MTRPPRSRSDPKPVTTADLERLAERIGERMENAVEGVEDRLGDRIARVEAKGDARMNEQAKRDAEAAAWRESQTGENREIRKMIAFNDSASQLRFEGLEAKAAPRVEESATHAAEHVIEANREMNRRTVGWVILGVTVPAPVVALVTWSLTNPKTLINVLHAIGFGLRSIPGAKE